MAQRPFGLVVRPGHRNRLAGWRLHRRGGGECEQFLRQGRKADEYGSAMPSAANG
jgi:hypothetical protein